MTAPSDRRLVKRHARGTVTASVHAPSGHEAAVIRALEAALQIHPSFDPERFRHALRESGLAELEIDEATRSVTLLDEVFLGG